MKIGGRMINGLILSLLIGALGSFFISGTAFAQPVTANFVASGLVPFTFPLAPTSKGKWDLTISPAYFSAQTTDYNNSSANDSASVTGYGLGASSILGLSEHWGLGVTGIAFSGQGSYNPGTLGVPGSTGPNSVTTSGYFAGVSAIWDYFEGDGFRLPILLGLHYETLQDNYNLGSYTVTNNLNSPGFQVGISPQFRTKYIRIQPFLMLYYPINNTIQTQSTGQTYTMHSDTGGPQPGINLVYVPWNVSFFTTYGISKAQGEKTYSVRWQKSFGEDKKKPGDDAVPAAEPPPPAPIGPS